MDTLTIDKFGQYSLIDDPTKLPLGALIEGSKNIDPTRQLGPLSPRLGTESQIASLGAGGVKGIHTYRRSSGDRILFKYGTDIYKLGGTTTTTTKTSTADFDAGTKGVRVDTSNNELKLLKTGAEALLINQSQGSYGYSLNGATNPIGETFIAPESGISAISIYVNGATFGVGQSVTCKVYDSPSKNTLFGQASVSGNLGGGDIEIKFNLGAIGVLKNGLYYAEITASGGTTTVYYDIYERYASGTLYTSGNPTTGELRFKLYGSSSFYVTDTWTSPVYDNGTTPAGASLSWNKTLPVGSSLIVRARGSENNQQWGDWQVIGNGGGIPNTRYYQVSIDLTTEGGSTPIVQDFTVTVETAYTQASSISSSRPANKMRAVGYNDVCYIADGGRPIRFNGTTVRNVGVDPPASAPTLTASGTGLTGVFKYVVTYYTDYGAESNAGPSASISLTNQGVTLSNIPIGPTGTTQRNIYRTKANGLAYYYVGTITNNTSTTFNDSTLDANLVEPLKTDNDLPPNATIIHEFKNYMLYVLGDRVWASKPKLPDSVPKDSDKLFPGPILAVATYQDSLIVGGKNFLAAVIGDIWDSDPDVDNMQIRIISQDRGPISHESTVECYSSDGDILVFSTGNEINYITPGLQENSMRSIPLSKDIQPMISGAVNEENMAAIFKDTFLYLSICYYGNGTPIQTNNTICKYDLRTGQWCPPWDIPASGFCIANNKLYIGSSVVGKVLEIEKGTSDDGAPITKIANLSQVLGQRRMKVKKARIGVTDTSNTSTLQLIVGVDDESEPVTFGATSTWDKPSFSNREPVSLDKGNRITLSVQDTSTNDWTINLITLEYQKC